MPALVHRYSVSKSDIVPLGFDLIEIEEAITPAVVAQMMQDSIDPRRRRQMVARNDEIARQRDSFSSVTPILDTLYQRAQTLQ